MKLLRSLLFASISLGLFVAVTLAARQDAFTALDFDVTAQLQGKMLPHTMDPGLEAVSQSGQFEAITLVLLALVIMYRSVPFAVAVFGSYGLGHVVGLIGKTTLDHPGPPFMFIRQGGSALFPALHVQTESSYPSGHSFRAIFMFLVIVVLTKHMRRNSLGKVILLIVMLLWALSVVSAQVIMGKHWFSDVIGGVLLGVCMGMLVEFGTQLLEWVAQVIAKDAEQSKKLAALERLESRSSEE